MERDMKTPWTQGPWVAEQYSDHWVIMSNDDPLLSSFPIADWIKNRDAKLIALAPEMAEAILAWDRFEGIAKLKAVTNKIQKIVKGKENE